MIIRIMNAKILRPSLSLLPFVLGLTSCVLEDVRVCDNGVVEVPTSRSTATSSKQQHCHNCHQTDLLSQQDRSCQHLMEIVTSEHNWVIKTEDKLVDGIDESTKERSIREKDRTMLSVKCEEARQDCRGDR